MRKISLVLLITGIVVGVSPIVGQLYTRYRENRMMDEWLNSIEEKEYEDVDETDSEKAYLELREAFEKENPESRTSDDREAAEDMRNNTAPETGTPSDGEAVEDAGNNTAPGADQPGTSEKPAKKGKNQTVIGIIQIKKINVKAPILEGVRESSLSSGIGHIPGTPLPGEPGNCALAGHRSYTFGKFFNRLDKLEVDDEIIITTKNEDLVYKVSKIHVVTPDDTSVIKGSKDQSIITLITCTPVYIASHRLIVKAELKERIQRES